MIGWGREVPVSLSVAGGIGADSLGAGAEGLTQLPNVTPKMTTSANDIVFFIFMYSGRSITVNKPGINEEQFPWNGC